MRFRGRELGDWQEQVWDAKKKVYEETKDKTFQEYLAHVREGARAFLAEGRLACRELPDGVSRIEPVGE